MQQNKFVLIWSLCANHVRFLSRTVMHGYYIRFPLWKCSISSSKKLIEEVIFLLNRYAQKTSQIRACTYPYLLAYYTQFLPILRQYGSYDTEPPICKGFIWNLLSEVIVFWEIFARLKEPKKISWMQFSKRWPRNALRILRNTLSFVLPLLWSVFTYLPTYLCFTSSLVCFCLLTYTTL